MNYLFVLLLMQYKSNLEDIGHGLFSCKEFVVFLISLSTVDYVTCILI